MPRATHSDSPAFSALPLRQRKYARTKYGLLQAALARLDHTSLDAINVKDLCADVGISEASFFNYFPRKTDLLVYFIQLWSIDVAARASSVRDERGAVAAIEEVFRHTAEQAQEHPQIFPELIGYQARAVEPPALAEITAAERLLAFPDRPGVEEAPAGGVESVFPPLVRAAVAAKELPAHTDERQVFVALVSVFFGAPLIERRVPASLAGTFRFQLSLLWAGLRSAPPPARASRRKKTRRKKS